MIDFTNCTEKINKFRGSEKKKTIEYNGKTYLLKFPDPTREKGKSISYINNTISEYIGCKIYESAGIETQNVILGTYVNDSGVSKIVVYQMSKNIFLKILIYIKCWILLIIVP